LTDEATRTGEDGVTKSRVRYRTYWITSIAATLIFLLFVFLMMMVPGVSWEERAWMLSIAATALAVPLAIGIWRFGTTEAPIMEYPVGPIVYVILFLQEGVCVINVLILVVKKPIS
jgi:hypothetical protein